MFIEKYKQIKTSLYCQNFAMIVKISLKLESLVTLTICFFKNKNYSNYIKIIVKTNQILNASFFFVGYIVLFKILDLRLRQYYK